MSDTLQEGEEVMAQTVITVRLPVFDVVGELEPLASDLFDRTAAGSRLLTVL